MGEGYIPKIPLGVAKGILGVDAGGAQLAYAGGGHAVKGDRIGLRIPAAEALYAIVDLVDDGIG